MFGVDFPFRLVARSPRSIWRRTKLGDTMTTIGDDTRRLDRTDVMRAKVRHPYRVINALIGVLRCGRIRTVPVQRDGTVGELSCLRRTDIADGRDRCRHLHGYRCPDSQGRRRAIYEAAQQSTRLHVTLIGGGYAPGLRVSLKFLGERQMPFRTAQGSCCPNAALQRGAINVREPMRGWQLRYRV